jgi:outer membrane biosynthesis protein TonB
MKTMKTQLLALSAAALLLAATVAAADPISESSHYASRVEPKVERLLRDAGIGPETPPVSVRATVAPDGHLTGLTIVRSSGSPQTDGAVSRILRQVLVSQAPVGLFDGAVTLNVGTGARLETATR